MKAPSRHIFSLLILLVAFAANGQDPGKPATERKDTAKTATDTLRSSLDSLNLPSDTLKIPRDTVKTVVVVQDTIRSGMDTTNVASDTLKFEKDTKKILPDTFNLTMEPKILEDTLKEVSKDSIISKEDKQKPKEKPIKVPREKLPKDTVIGPSGIEFYLDYGKLLTLPSEFERKAEAGAAINIREKILLLFEMGYGKLSPQEAIKNGSYTSEGIYSRGGVAYGGAILPKTYLYFGIMYGISRFEDNSTVLIDSQAWDDLDGVFTRSDLEATWFEIILVSETEIKKNLFLGSKWRLRKLNSFDNDYDPVVYSIPGYGRTFDNSIPALNLYVKYRFAIKSKK